jgi:hypothetical protein
MSAETIALDEQQQRTGWSEGAGRRPCGSSSTYSPTKRFVVPHGPRAGSSGSVISAAAFMTRARGSPPT